LPLRSVKLPAGPQGQLIHLKLGSNHRGEAAASVSAGLE
jgi:hypothetical protein